MGGAIVGAMSRMIANSNSEAVWHSAGGSIALQSQSDWPPPLREDYFRACIKEPGHALGFGFDLR